MNEKSMNCKSVTSEQLEALQKQLTLSTAYKASAENRIGIVQFDLNIPGLDTNEETETLLFVYSNKIAANVFAGKFQENFSVEIDERLIEDGPGDNLEFRLLRVKQQSSCVNVQQVGHPFWQPGATVTVRFLRERYLDQSTGVPVSFEVNIERP